MTDHELRELLRVCEAATEGEWSTGGTFNPNSKYPRQNVWGPTPKGRQSGSMVCQQALIPDAKAIVASHNALPTIIRDLLELRAAARETCSVYADIGQALGEMTPPYMVDSWNRLDKLLPPEATDARS